MKQYLTRTERLQASMIAGMICGSGLPLAITLTAAIIEVFH